MDIILDTVFSNPALPIAPRPGFYDDFTRADGPVGYTSAEQRPWRSSAVGAGVPHPLVIANRRAQKGDGGTTRTAWTVDAHAADGTLTAVIGSIGSATDILAVRARDSDNYIGLTLRRTESDLLLGWQKRIDGTATTVGSSGSVQAASGDVLQIVCNGPLVTIKVNGEIIFGGSRSVDEFTGETRHGLILQTATGTLTRWAEIGFEAAS